MAHLIDNTFSIGFSKSLYKQLAIANDIKSRYKLKMSKREMVKKRKQNLLVYTENYFRGCINTKIAIKKIIANSN